MAVELAALLSVTKREKDKKLNSNVARSWNEGLKERNEEREMEANK